jgi:hypothetical protein
MEDFPSAAECCDRRAVRATRTAALNLVTA